jgi:hypothetical protein
MPRPSPLGPAFRFLCRGLAFFLAFLLLLPPSLSARKRWKPVGRPIRQIDIIHKDIFDTDISNENKLLFRLVNRMHFSTKDWVIRAELLLKEGEPYDEELARESERALRKILQLRRVRIWSAPVEGGMVDVRVEVHETWTTEPTISLQGVGKDLSGKIGIREENFLGFGKEVSYFYKKDNGIIERAFGYSDPNVFKTRLNMTAGYTDSAEGLGRVLTIGRPFYSSVTPWAASFGGELRDMNTRLYEDGIEVQKINEYLRDTRADIAFSIGSTPKNILRAGLGYHYLRRRLSATFPARVPLSDDKYHILEANLHREKVNFLTVDHIDKYDREEDFNLGPLLIVSPGYSMPWIAESKPATFLKLEAQSGKRFGPSHFTLTNLKTDGRYEEGGWLDTRAGAESWYFHHFSPRQTYAFHIEGETILDPAANSQLLLGGDTGLRGYQLNQFEGNKMLLANAEHRLFLIDDVWRLLGLGSVVFFDAGNVWEPGKKIDLRNLKMDVGTGLRFHISRSSAGHVLRLDVAYALKEVHGKSRTVVTFGSEQAF